MAKSFDPARHSSLADVKPSREGILLDLKWTKTLQTQRGVTTIPMAALQDKRICPVSTWDFYRHMLPWVTPDSTTLLLLTAASPVGKVISASTLRVMFHRAAESAGLSAKHYTPTASGEGELLSVFRQAFLWTTSRSTALGRPTWSTDTCSSTRNSRHPWPKPFKLPSPPTSPSKAPNLLPRQGHNLPASARRPILLVPARRQQPACLSKAPNIAHSGKASTTCPSQQGAQYCLFRQGINSLLP